MARQYQRFLGEFTLPSSADTFNIVNSDGDSFQIALTTGDYFMDGYTDEATSQFCEHVSTQLASAAPGSNITLDHTNGFTIFNFAGNPHNILWEESDLMDLLGFEANTSCLNTHTSAKQARYCWFPGRCMATYPGDLNIFWTERSTSMVTISKDGTTYGDEGDLLYDASCEYRLLDESEVIRSGDGDWKALQHFWRDVVHSAKEIRFFPDRDANGSTDYKRAIMVPPGSDGGDEPIEISSFEQYKARHADNFNGLWAVVFKLVKYVQP